MSKKIYIIIILVVLILVVLYPKNIRVIKQTESDDFVPFGLVSEKHKNTYNNNSDKANYYFNCKCLGFPVGKYAIINKCYGLEVFCKKDNKQDGPPEGYFEGQKEVIEKCKKECIKSGESDCDKRCNIM